MNRNKVLLLVLLLASFSLAACSGPTTVCTVNCGGGGSATVSFTLVANTLPANPSILSFKVTIDRITLTPTTGTAQTFTPNPALVFNLNNAISLSGGTLAVNFNPSSPNPGVFTAFTLPRTNANLGTNQLELIEDFTGVVGISGSTVTITSPTRGTLTAISTSNSFFDPSPDGSICPTPATVNCVANGQIASVDAFLNT